MRARGTCRASTRGRAELPTGSETGVRREMVRAIVAQLTGKLEVSSTDDFDGFYRHISPGHLAAVLQRRLLLATYDRNIQSVLPSFARKSL